MERENASVSHVHLPWKLSFLDLLFPLFLFFIVMTFNIPTASAPRGSWHVSGNDYHSIVQYYGVTGYLTTVNLQVTQGSGSFVSLKQITGDFFSHGFLQGYDGNHIWQATPHYFVDRLLRGSYSFWIFGQAPVGQNHQYWVFENYGAARMNADLDGTCVKQESGYSQAGFIASADTETHASTDPMNHHFWGLKAALVELRYGNWHDDVFHVDSPYHQNVISQTEWYATGP